jgi:nicotinamide mononucleotide transporter
MLQTAFSIWGSAVTWLEILAFVLSLACVCCNIAELHWGWPLAIISSALYCWLFYESKLYGDGSLQIFFALTGAWGWWQWLFGKRYEHDEKPLAIAQLTRHQCLYVCIAWLVMWLALGLFLQHFTDTDVPWFDAFPTAGSIIGTVLLARKYLENWHVWVLVNIVSVALFVYKSLYLTVVLYVIFIAMAVWGWHVWRLKLQQRLTSV